MLEESHRKQPATAQSRPAAPKSGSRAHVLPDQISPEILQFIRQSVHANSLIGGFKWIMERLGETDLIELTEHFLDRYEQQVVRLKGDLLKDNMPIFRVALYAKCMEVLPLFSNRLAQAGINPLFLRIWFQKRLLSILIGISVVDIERRARASGLKMPDYLTDQIGRLYPQTALAKYLAVKK